MQANLDIKLETETVYKLILTQVCLLINLVLYMSGAFHQPIRVVSLGSLRVLSSTVLQTGTES